MKDLSTNLPDRNGFATATTYVRKLQAKSELYCNLEDLQANFKTL